MNSIRLGSFQTATNLGLTKLDKSSSNQSPILCIFWGGTSGVIGHCIGCPLYMVKTQIQAQSVSEFAVGYQHNHKGMVDAFRNIIRKEGFIGIWRGVNAMVPKAAVGSSAQLTSFAMCKETLVQYEVNYFFL